MDQAEAGATQHSPGLPQVNPSILTFGLPPTEELHAGVPLSTLPAAFMLGELQMEEADDSACMTNWASCIIGLLARAGGEPQKNPSLSKSSCSQIKNFIHLKELLEMGIIMAQQLSYLPGSEDQESQKHNPSCRLV